MKIKILFLAILQFSIPFFLTAQPWMKNTSMANPNFFEIQKSFYEYHKKILSEKEMNTYESNNIEERDDYYSKYKRWEYYWETRVDGNGNFPPSDILWNECKKYNAQKNVLKSSIAAANWTFAGPSTFSLFGTQSGGIGRVNCIAFHPTVQNTFWIGTPDGGLWKTIDGGLSWTTTTDNMPILGISDIAVDYTNPNIIYIATGDGETALITPNSVRSIGVLKSVDGGLTFNPTGLSNLISAQKLTNRILIHPTNPLILLVAASDGIWRTTNGGTTWTNQQAGWFTDLEFKPSDPNYIYASTLSVTGTSHIYRSIDNGFSWTQMTFFSGVNKMDLAVSPTLPDVVSALCVNTYALGGLEGVYSSINSGTSFTQVITGDCTNNMLNREFDGTACGGQGVFDLAYAINPIDPNEVWIAGVNNWATLDGGVSWNLKSMYTFNATLNPAAVNYLHSDKHKIAFHPLNVNIMYSLSDGGIQVTYDGINWLDLSNGLGITQMYRLGTSTLTANKVLCGAQDVGLKLKTGSSWLEIQGGDNMEEIIDPTDDNVQYSESYTGYLYRTLDNWATNTVIANNIPGFAAYFTTYGAGPGAWVTPVVMDPINNQTLYIGFGNIWKTTDRGNTWSAISSFGLSKPLQSIAIAPSNNQVIYASTYDTLVITSNGGTTWNYTTVGNITGISTDKISYITISPTNPLSLWVTISGFDAGNKIFKSINGGVTWTNISGTLPNIPVNCSVYENGSSDGLYIGTDVGVYYRDNSLTDWIPYNNGLPNVQVNELEISYLNNKLWAATFGRALWESNLYSYVGLNESENLNNNVSIFPNPSSGEFILELKNIKDEKLEVYSVLGQKVYELNIVSTKTAIDLKRLTKGIYFVKILSAQGNVDKKIIIK